MTTLTFFVPGIPVPKGSMKAFIPKGWNRAVLTNDNPKSKPWASVISLTAAMEASNIEWKMIELYAIAVQLVFYMPRPRGHYGSGKNVGVLKQSAPLYPAKKPDIDKLSRLVLDALTGIVWKDDGQVGKLAADKRFAIDGQTGVAITIWERR